MGDLNCFYGEGQEGFKCDRDDMALEKDRKLNKVCKM